ncbi:MAG: gluconate 2-dehydrogenase subunit 3 family protein [Solirubrobacteraceae bacterium]
MTERESSPVDEWSGLTRRRFLERSAGVAGGLTAAAAVGGSGLLESASALAASAPVALTAAELATLTAVLTQLLPADSLGPGAVEAGVPTYIDRSLAGSYKPLLPAYQSFLPMFDTAAQTMGASSFSALPAAEQISLLSAFETGTPPGIPASEATTVQGLFQLLLEHMREGMFGDPMYGGNQNLAGWTLIGYPGIQLVTTAADQKINANVKPSNKTARSYGGKPYNGPPV